MPDLPSVVVVAALASLALLALREQLRAARAGRRYRMAGLGLVDDDTDLHTLGAVPIYFPTEVDIARALGQQLTVAVLRVDAEPVQAAGRELASAMRRYEHAYRADYGTFVAVLLVNDRAAAVEAVSRLGRLMESTVTETSATNRHPVHVGVAQAGDDGTDFLDLAGVASKRLRALHAFEDIARSISETRDGGAERQNPVSG